MKRFLLLFAGLVTVAIVVLFCLTVFDNTNKPIQTVNASDSGSKFVLLTRLSGFGDPSWFVYRIDADQSSIWTIGMDPLKAQSQGLCWNYAEAGNLTTDARIRVEKGRYLVFSRGMLDHCLHDIAEESTLVHEASPWHATPIPDSVISTQLSVEERNVMVRAWTREHLHERIASILRDAT